jgi:tRNA threonylcarbamoyladenosine biosynthesis protein TsaE
VNRLFLPDEAATLKAGAALARACGGRGLICLSGDLGAGKTTLSRGLIQGLGHVGAVKSPTYTLVEPYALPAADVFHYDLYRLGDPEELEYLGLRDHLDGQSLCLIEWPERGASYLPAPDLSLYLKILPQGRELLWEAFTAGGETLAAALAALGH